jgi:hypothetical protein
MLCLEVAVNGKRYCLAGADDVSFVYATVESRRRVPRLFGSGFELTVRQPLGCAYWGEWRRHLRVGDVVMIRLVESNVPDSPRYLPTESPVVVDGVVAQPELFAYSTRIPDGLGGFLVWVAVAILGVVLLWLTPHG